MRASDRISNPRVGHVNFRVTADELASITTAAERSGVKVREWARRIVLKAAIENAGLSEEKKILENVATIRALLLGLAVELGVDSETVQAVVNDIERVKLGRG